MKISKLLIIVVAITLFLIGTTFVFYKKGIFDKHKQISLPDQSFLFTVLDKQTNSGEIRMFGISEKSTKTIYNFTLTSPWMIPTVSPYFNKQILLDLESPEQYLVTIPTKEVKPVKKTENRIFELLSPQGTYLAFNRFKTSKNELIDDTELVIRSEDGKEQVLEGGSVSNIGVGLLTPLHWSEDEKKLYSYRGHATEGDIVGLYEIDVLTSEQNRIEAVDELGISKYVFDNLGNVYGFKPFYRIRPEDKLQNTFYRVSLTTGEVTDFTLQDSSLIDMYTIDHSGRFLAYANGDNFDSQDVWIYDLESGEEYPVTNNAIVYDVLQWNDGKIVFIEHSASQPAQSKIIVFDYNKNTSNVIFKGEGEIIDLIGWYYK